MWIESFWIWTRLKPAPKSRVFFVCLLGERIKTGYHLHTHTLTHSHFTIVSNIWRFSHLESIQLTLQREYSNESFNVPNKPRKRMEMFWCWFNGNVFFWWVLTKRSMKIYRGFSIPMQFKHFRSIEMWWTIILIKASILNETD